MKSDRIMRSKIYRFLDYIFRLVVLNLLAIIPSFSFLIVYVIITNANNSRNNILEYVTLIPVLFLFFPSVVACFDVIKQYETDETNTIFKDFFKSFKKHYLNSLLISIIFMIIGFLLYNSAKFFYNYAFDNVLYIIGLVVTISFIAIVLMILVHLPLVMAYFGKMRFVETVKLSCIMAFKDIINSILMVIILVIMIVLNILLYVLFIVGGAALTIYLMVKISFKQYIKIYRKVEKNEN